MSKNYKIHNVLRRFERVFADLEHRDMRDLSTGCHKPCKYRKYRLVGHPKSERRPDNLESPRNFGLRAFTHYTTVGRKISMLFNM